MQYIDLDTASDILASANIEKTLDAGTTIVHHGLTAEGHRFTLMNDCAGCSCIAYHTH